jgi:hypothetical protein
MSVAAWSGSLLKWEQELSELKARLSPVFGRAETRASASAFIDGLFRHDAQDRLAIGGAGGCRATLSDAIVAWASFVARGSAARQGS